MQLRQLHGLSVQFAAATALQLHPPPLTSALPCLALALSLAASGSKPGMALLDGRWRLLYSSGFTSGSLGSRRPGPSFGSLPLTLGPVYQDIYTGGLKGGEVRPVSVPGQHLQLGMNAQLQLAMMPAAPADGTLQGVDASCSSLLATPLACSSCLLPH